MVYLAKEKEANDWLALFRLIEAFAMSKVQLDTLENQEDFNNLSPATQKRLVDAITKPSDDNRIEKTIELEILAGLESPVSEQGLRRQIQVALMQDKMTSGQSVSMEQSFFDWLGAGTFTEETLILANRIKPIFIQ